MSSHIIPNLRVGKIEPSLSRSVIYDFSFSKYCITILKQYSMCYLLGVLNINIFVIVLASEENPFGERWYQKYALESFPTDLNFAYLAKAFEENIYMERGFHRVKGEDPPDWNTFVSFSSRPDFSDLRDVLVLRSDEIAEYGHQAEDLILQCTYNEQTCHLRYTFYVNITLQTCVVFWYQNSVNTNSTLTL